MAQSNYDHRDFYLAYKDISQPPEAANPASPATEASKAPVVDTPKSPEPSAAKAAEGKASPSPEASPSA
jgi:hypothetical protein